MSMQLAVRDAKRNAQLEYCCTECKRLAYHLHNKQT